MLLYSLARRAREGRQAIEEQGDSLIEGLQAIGGSERGIRSLASDIVHCCICTLHESHDSNEIIGSIARPMHCWIATRAN